MARTARWHERRKSRIALKVFMNSDIMSEVLPMVDGEVQSGPTAMEFELAYQARVAMDRIRFAIRHGEQFAPQTDQMHETNLQLLDALQRLETAERRFQERSRVGKGPGMRTPPFPSSINGCVDNRKHKSKA